MVSRRTFLARGVGAAVGAALMPRALGMAARGFSGPLGRQVGLQLYTLRELAATDLDATLQAVARIGYGEVELAGLYGRSPSAFAGSLRSAGLVAPAAHYSMFDLQNAVEDKLEALNELEVAYLVCSFPGVPDPARYADRAGGPGGAILRGEISLDEWRWNADQLNRIGRAARAAGLGFAYHNHAMEFTRYGETSAFDELLRLADPGLVSLELDCGWVAQGGEDPAGFVRRLGERVRLLHIKDVAKPSGAFRSTEVGNGVIDWKAVFAAADPRHLDHYFVEQEHFERPPLEAVEVSLGYLRELRV